MSRDISSCAPRVTLKGDISMKREVIIVNDFYQDPDAVIRYAKGLRYYNPF